MSNPTRRRRRKGSDGAPRARTSEELAWPEEARVLSVMAHGFAYDEAWHMSLGEYHRYTALAAAWAIPPDEREGTVVRATAAQADDFT